MSKACAVPGCERKRAFERRHCSAHVSRLARHGSLQVEIEIGSRYHGLAKHPLYKTWLNLRNRCNNPRGRNFERYGGRGIKVCERWSKFQNFLIDMGERPSPAHSIDRRDNSRGYGPKNCRWATRAEQACNRTSTKLSRAKVERIKMKRKNGKSFTDIAQDFKVSRQTVSRVCRGLSWA